MPLILVTGLPSSGKSETAKIIFQFLKERLEQHDPRKVRIVSDSDVLDWDGRDTIYSSIAKEKELRGWLRAEAQRYVNLNQIVILDAAAYIKGFRYEIFCLCKEAQTQYCVVERLISSDVCWNWNKLYSRETFDGLVMRYEECDQKNRWDSPLFKMRSESETLDLEAIYREAIEEDPLRSNKCTSLASSTVTVYKP